ncbi:hypothetical protein PAK_01002 [Pseudomonas aeruginosa PAK]|uniref:hypothetical protein n=1 Tax=Pseudomonas aeruginosa TaxID=287 RepID=UPI00033EAC73|nr:hypothetical protein [Pseudomonas aeruginosa]ARI03863.1 hypothetical protein Y880_04041 [Pseudomonas aeruginosa PAK]EOT22725.1 hypothetical protein PAK_01002 [Pseudomonas aeruginosa PAK]RMK88302.1 hypothetical protein IPC83_26585 [Pseudomonas aeruginosa]VUY42968.1 hypothetical protein PAKAF_00788 [Pseudomonas aeruginosa PAK]
MSEFEALPTLSQHSSDSDSAVLYLRQDAPAYQFLHAAEYRFGALAELLAVLSLGEDKAEVPAALQRSARAFLLLASDARGLYCAACQRQGVV